MRSKIFAALVLMLVGSRPSLAAPIELVTPTGTLYGTLELPEKQPCPVAIILAGSGPTNRDGDSLVTGGENDSLRLLAEGLLAQGIASVRYDKRGVATSLPAGPKEADLRFENYIDDAVLWGQKLQQDERFSSLTIIGHSEGSLVGMVAAGKLKAAGFVSIAGVGRPIGQVLLEQIKLQMPPESLQKAENLIRDISEGKTNPTVPPALVSLFRPSVQPYLISWFRYNPIQEIEKLAMPILIVQGTSDIQISVEDAKALAKAKPTAELLIIEGMNHVLKDVGADKALQTRSYTEPSLPVNAKLIRETARFINRK
ncbi:alpha/beta hydrolase [bacterium]|nr:MAG: alpha/beta hydrolase [bacterium]